MWRRQSACWQLDRTGNSLGFEPEAAGCCQALGLGQCLCSLPPWAPLNAWGASLLPGHGEAVLFWDHFQLTLCQDAFEKSLEGNAGLALSCYKNVQTLPALEGGSPCQGQEGTGP